MSFQVSPGVNVSEIDLTSAIPATSVSTGAFAGFFNWGPALVPVTVTSEVELASKFGKPDNNSAASFFTSASFLSYSNDLKVVRASATGANNAGSAGAVNIPNDDFYFSNEYQTTGSTPWAARFLGALGNSLEVKVWANSAAWQADVTGGDPYASLFDYGPGTSPFVASATGFTGANDEIHVVVIDQDGLITGTAGTVLEKYASLSVIADAKTSDGSSNYYKEVIYRNSKWIHWMGHPQVSHTGWGSTTSQITGNSYITQDATANTMSLTGGTDGSIVDGDVEKALDVLANPEFIDISLLFVGSADATVASYAIDNVGEVRKDCVVFVSPPLANVQSLTNPETSITNWANSVSRSSYAVMDSGWKYMYDKYNDIYRWVPLNGDLAGLCARTDNTRDPWWSPAGLQRGSVKNVVKLAFNPNKAQRDTLYKAGVNPVVSFPGEGTILYGDKTFQNRPSAFDRINVRRLFIVLEKAISKAARSSLFEFNDDFTRAQFVSLVEPFLRTVKGRRGVYDFKVVCDTTNNTPDIIDRNEFVGDIYIKPARSVNFITLNFVAVRTGVTFDEVVGKF